MKSLGDRMKEYERVPDIRLTRRTPVVVRIDGRHFHTYTRGFDKPFDPVFSGAMRDTTLNLCKNVQGCILGYTQSDEISLVLCDYKHLESQAWFDNRLQKIVSVSAAMATKYFNTAMELRLDGVLVEEDSDDVIKEYIEKYAKSIAAGAEFDARAFNLPKEEVCNYLIWRQQDAERNSILALAQSLFSHSELQGISCKRLQDKMFTEKGVNWNDLHSFEKRGVFVVGDWIYPETPRFIDKRVLIESMVNCVEEA